MSYCGTCDGFFFRDKDIVVVGGGDSALEEGIFLTKFASHVRIVHRRDELRAGYTLQARAKRNEKIEFIWNSVVTEINGSDGAVHFVQMKNLKSGEVSTLKTDGVFIYVGHFPNNRLFADKLALDEHGYLIIDEHARTSVPGVFAAAAKSPTRSFAKSSPRQAQAARQAWKLRNTWPRWKIR